MDPNNENPFQAILNGSSGQQGAAAGMTAPQPNAQMPPMGGGQGGGNMKVPAEQQNPTEFGVHADNAKPLVSAISSIHSYLGSVTDSTKVQTARLLIQILTKLLDEEQEGAPSEAPQGY